MKAYQFEFLGRTKDALGTRSIYTATRIAETEDEARTALYDEYEHIIVSWVSINGGPWQKPEHP